MRVGWMVGGYHQNKQGKTTAMSINAQVYWNACVVIRRKRYLLVGFGFAMSIDKWRIRHAFTPKNEMASKEKKR